MCGRKEDGSNHHCIRLETKLFCNHNCEGEHSVAHRLSKRPAFELAQAEADRQNVKCHQVKIRKVRRFIARKMIPSANNPPPFFRTTTTKTARSRVTPMLLSCSQEFFCLQHLFRIPPALLGHGCYSC
jgi:hypothetical protein